MSMTAAAYTNVREIDVTQRMTLREFVETHNGRRVIDKILIANNGIAALKAIRSIKKWCYETLGDDKAISFVAMATPEDIKVNAAYIHLADEFVEVPGGSNNNNYANVMLITELAERVGAKAVWAGWGHASENPKLPDALAKTDVGFKSCPCPSALLSCHFLPAPPCPFFSFWDRDTQAKTQHYTRLPYST